MIFWGGAMDFYPKSNFFFHLEQKTCFFSMANHKHIIFFSIYWKQSFFSTSLLHRILYIYGMAFPVRWRRDWLLLSLKTTSCHVIFMQPIIQVPDILHSDGAGKVATISICYSSESISEIKYSIVKMLDIFGKKDLHIFRPTCI